MDLLADPPPDPETLRRDGQAVALFDHDRWKSLVRTLLKIQPRIARTLVTNSTRSRFRTAPRQSGHPACLPDGKQAATLRIESSIGEETFSHGPMPI
jgi:hypothetical protein